MAFLHRRSRSVLSDKDILKGLGRIALTPEQRANCERIAMSLSTQDRARSAFDIAREHRVVPILMANVLRSKPDARCSIPTWSEIAKYNDAQLRQQEETIAELVRIFHLLQRRHKTDLLIVKGVSVGQLYPSPYNRSWRDIDIVLGDIESAAQLYDIFIEEGYKFDRYEVPFLRGIDDHLAGQFSVTQERNCLTFSFDVHFGGFEYGYSSLLNFDLLAENADALYTAEGSSILVPSIESRAIVLMAHVVSQGHFRRNDVNDIIVLMTQDGTNWQWVFDKCVELGLESILLALVRETGAEFPDMSTSLDRFRLPEILSRFWRFQPRQPDLLRSILYSIASTRAELGLSGNKVGNTVGYGLRAFIYCVYMLRIWNTRELTPVYRQRTPFERLVLRLYSADSAHEGMIVNEGYIHFAPAFEVKNFNTEWPSLLNERGFRTTAISKTLWKVSTSGITFLLSSHHVFIPTFDFIVDTSVLHKVQLLLATELDATLTSVTLE